MAPDNDVLDGYEDETTPLLMTNAKPKFTWSWSSPVSLKTGRIILLVFLPFIHFAIVVPQTTTLVIVQRFICSYWYIVNDPKTGPPTQANDPLCQIPGVNSWFSGFLTIITVTAGLENFITFSIVGRKADSYGRKPFLVLILILEFIGTYLLPLSELVTYTPLAITVQLLWVFKPPMMLVLGLVINLIVVDLSEPSERTRWLLLAGGMGALGRMPAFAVGGLITSKTGNPLAVFYISGALTLFMALCVVFAVPESLSQDKMDQIRTAHAASTGTSIVTTILIPLRQLQQLLPTRDEKTGKRTTRLFLIALPYFLWMFVASYIGQAVITYAIARFHFNAESNGYLLTTATTCATLWTLVIAPLLLKFFERFYRSSTLPHERGEAPFSSTTASLEPHNFARRDIHVAAGSYFLETLSLVLVGLAQTGPQLIAAFGLFATGSSAASAVLSAVAASVAPLKHGEVFAALEMVTSIATCLGPVQGILLTLIINKAPQVLFFLAAGITVSAGIIILFVKDSERYQAAEEERPVNNR